MASGNDQFRLREAFVTIGNVLESQPGAKFWAGERYYRRQHIDIDDFYPLDASGYGGGVEDRNVGIGKLAVAFISAARPSIITQNGVGRKFFSGLYCAPSLPTRTGRTDLRVTWVECHTTTERTG